MSLTPDFTTGKAPPGASSQRPASEKDLVELWFVKPLLAMDGDEAFACLTICFPLLEAIMRRELGIPDEHDVKFSENAKALHWFAKFMTIPEAQSGNVWDSLRNGLLHRAMIKADVDYVLTGERAGRPADYKGGALYVYVWDFRDAVVKLLRTHHKRLWKDGSSPLPRVYAKF